MSSILLAPPGSLTAMLKAAGVALAAPDGDKAAMATVIYGSTGAVISSTNPLQVNLAQNLAGEDFSKSATGRILVALEDATNPAQVQGVTAVGQALVSLEGQEATYHLSGFVTPAATPTDVIQIQGSASKTIRILYVAISIESTAAGIADVLLIRRSTTDTGGTSSAPTIGKSATADAAAAAAVLVWTANPAGLGTLVSNVGAKKVGGTTNPLAEWNFYGSGGKPLVLSGATDFFCVNGNGDTLLAGEVWAYDIIWTER